MTPRIECLNEKKLIGKRLTMSLADNKTGMLWQDFMPRRKEIINNLTTDLISLQIYPETYFTDFNPANLFEKWATAEVADFDNIPAGMEPLILKGGLYAAFDYKGPAGDGSIFQYIFTEWLPGSLYTLDHRPHFEVLGSKYRNNDRDSEEEIWIPVKLKNQAG